MKYHQKIIEEAVPIWALDELDGSPEDRVRVHTLQGNVKTAAIVLSLVNKLKLSRDRTKREKSGQKAYNTGNIVGIEDVLNGLTDRRVERVLDDNRSIVLFSDKVTGAMVAYGPNGVLEARSPQKWGTPEERQKIQALPLETRKRKFIDTNLNYLSLAINKFDTLERLITPQDISTPSSSGYELEMQVVGSVNGKYVSVDIRVLLRYASKLGVSYDIERYKYYESKGMVDESIHQAVMSELTGAYSQYIDKLYGELQEEIQAIGN